MEQLKGCLQTSSALSSPYTMLGLTMLLVLTGKQYVPKNYFRYIYNYFQLPSMKYDIY